MLKIKFSVMSYNMKVEKTSSTCKPTNEIKARREQHYYYYYYCPECCLTNCLMPKTVDGEVANLLPSCHWTRPLIFNLSILVNARENNYTSLSFQLSYLSTVKQAILLVSPLAFCLSMTSRPWKSTGDLSLQVNPSPASSGVSSERRSACQWR